MKNLHDTKIPTYIFLVALFLAILTLLPFWRAQSQTPPGWQFTGNLLTSPDMMQYRIWMRQSAAEGPLVENKLTTEENKPHLLVIYYYVIGKIADWLQVTPEWVYAYLGAVLVFLYTVLLYVIVRVFIRSASQAAWIFGIIILGGGLGAHLKILQNFEFIRQNPLLNRTIVQAVWNNAYFEDFRGNYLFRALFDSHYMLLWLLFTVTLIALYFCIKKFSTFRLVLTAGLSFFVTLLHVYEGLTLLAILAVMAMLFWRKRMLTRHTKTLLLFSALSILAGFGVIFLLYQNSGSPLPTWQGLNMLFSTLLISYPLAWVLIFIGIGNYWKNAGLEEVFLLGWAGGCVVIFLSAPFYPYSDRGSMTLQIPLYLVAGAIYFARFKRITLVALIVIVFTVMVTPTWVLYKGWKYSGFDPNVPALFINAEHRQLIETLKSKAKKDDILIADLAANDWERDLLWLGPEYPGRFYCGHFFLCVDYVEKRKALAQFYAATPQEKANFLQETDARFIFVGKEHDLAQFKQTPGMELLLSNRAGSIFEFQR